MLQNKVGKLYVHPTWFICREEFMVKVFHEIKLIYFVTVDVCGLYIRFNGLTELLLKFDTLII